MLSESCTFKELDINPKKEFNFVLYQEDRLTNFLENVNRSISDQLYQELDPRGFQIGWEWFGNVLFF